MYHSNCTQPDIAFIIQKLVKFMSNYETKHFKAAKHL
jgi:predicted RNA-binding protein with PUA-like domain